mmetsp:Transcript_4050/g.13543  ORF Transcript_4050/g.13543 Transcript_4050/m.13543 type:complete len:713 (+) Transcript_4050:348-2486(+)
MYVQLKKLPSFFRRAASARAAFALASPSNSSSSCDPCSCSCEWCACPLSNMSFPSPKGKPCECECECDSLPSESCRASHHPMAPMITSVAPTTPWPHCPITSMLNGSLSFNATKTKPNRICPVLCPQPHSAPIAAFWARLGPTVSGARAARWSGPVSVCRQPANRPAQADFRVVAASRNPGVLTNAPAPPSAAARTVGIENAPPTQHAANTPTVANNVLLRIRWRPKVPSKRTLFRATNKVEPSCSSTASHSGNAPTKAGNAEPRMETTARVMFCRSTVLVRAARRNKSGSCEIPSASACSNSTSAAAAAASLGVDATAMPTSAAAKAGASFMPSPTMATRVYFPVLLSEFASLRARSTIASFSPGVSPNLTSTRGNPTASATACALRSLSPVSIMTLILRPSTRQAPSRNARIATAALGCTASANRNTLVKFSDDHSASAAVPPAFPDPAHVSTTSAAVTFPLSDRAALTSRIARFCSSEPQISLAHSGFPNRARRGAPKLELVRIKPSTPEPCTTLKSVTVISGRARDLSCVFSLAVPVPVAASSTALAIGCVEARSRFAAIARAFGEKRGAESSVEETPSVEANADIDSIDSTDAPTSTCCVLPTNTFSTETHTIVPVVMVPVLSSATVPTSARASKVRPPRTKTPRLAAAPIAAMYTSGDMSKAHGAAALRKANARYIAPVLPRNGHPNKVGPRIMVSAVIARIALEY